MHIQVDIRGALEVDHVAAEILNRISSYGAADELVRYFRGKYSADELRLALNKIHCQTAEVIRARKRLLAAAVEHVS